VGGGWEPPGEKKKKKKKTGIKKGTGGKAGPWPGNREGRGPGEQETGTGAFREKKGPIERQQDKRENRWAKFRGF